MNSIAPIWNAVFSSDSTNAASLTGKLCCCGGWAVDSPARRATCASEALLVWASMKRETGCSAMRSAVSRPILSWSYGRKAWVQTCSPTGRMTRMVRIRAMPVMIRVGRPCCRPRAWRSSDSTITKRVKQVIIMTITGSSPSSVMSTRICDLTLMPALVEVAPGSTPASRSWFWAAAGTAISSPTSSADRSAGARALTPPVKHIMARECPGSGLRDRSPSDRTARPRPRLRRGRSGCR